jgi:hypothetical protein
MEIDESPEQFENADFSMRPSREPLSHVRLKSFEHESKHFSQSISADEGMQTEESDAHFENADCSIRTSRDPVPNATVARFEHESKLPSQTHSTDEGIWIDEMMQFPPKQPEHKC